MLNPAPVPVPPPHVRPELQQLPNGAARSAESREVQRRRSILRGDIDRYAVLFNEKPDRFDAIVPARPVQWGLPVPAPLQEGGAWEGWAQPVRGDEVGDHRAGVGAGCPGEGGGAVTVGEGGGVAGVAGEELGEGGDGVVEGG